MSDDPLIGSVIAERYRVDRLIGEGAMGRVYQAEHVLMRKRVALKVLHPQMMTVPEVIQRFEREARAAAQIEHPHVAGATDFGKLSDGGIYLILEFVEGVPLSQVTKKGPLPLSQVLTIACQVCSALDAAHARGIVHRDLKPDNLLLVQTDDGTDFVKVLDFGIAKVPTEPHEVGKPLTQVGVVYGTPEYMSPEQALGQDVDARADIYALGVILFEMLSGRRPYLGPASSLVGQQLSTPIPKIADVSKALVPVEVEELVRGLLIPEAKKRESQAAVVLGKLEALLLALEEGKLVFPARGSLLSSGFEEVTARFEEVTARLEQVTENLPQPVHRVVKSRRSRAALLALIFGAIGVVAAIIIVGAMVAKKPHDEAPEALTEPVPPVLDVPETEPNIEKKLIEAREQGIAALEKLAREYPTEGLVQAELALVQAKAKKYEQAVESARNALALDPNLNENPKVAGALYRAAQSNQARAAAFRLLQGAMGPAGVAIIFDLARTEGVHPVVQAQAEKTLAEPETLESASPALRLVLDLEETEKCEDVKALVSRAAIVGDKRALPQLTKLQETSGCGPRKDRDCYPCLRGDEELTVAIQTIEQRTTLVERTNEGASSREDEKAPRAQ